MPSIHPCLWFDRDAEAAAQLYTRLFPNSRITDTTRYPEGMPGDRAGEVMVVSVELDGQPVMLLNGGPMFTFSEATSLVITCADQSEIDHYYDGLTAGGGSPQPCGWVKDPFGFSWQVVPTQLDRYLGGDPEASQRAVAAMMTMTKLDLQALLDARAADPGHP